MSDYILHLGDCLEEMSRIEDGSVDMILADLPYGTTACKWDVIIPFEPLWAHYKRVIKRRGAVVLFGSEPFSSFLRLSNLDWYKYDWVWKKNRGSNFSVVKSHPMKEHEVISIFSAKTSRYNPIMQPRTGGGISRAKYKVNPSNTGKRDFLGHYADKYRNQFKELRYPSSVQSFNCEVGLHPTQKPVALLEYLICTYTNPGELVLDNVFGSCSTGEACLRTGRRFVGIEKDEGYYQIGVERMERVAAELRGEYIPKQAKGKIEDLPMFTEVAA